MDDYPDSYKVYLMPALKDADLPRDWTTLRLNAIKLLREVPVAKVIFDKSKPYVGDEWAIDSAILHELVGQRSAVG